MVSYMYQYEHGLKRKNVGYARVETRNGQSKITIHLLLPGQLNSIFPTYLIQRETGGIELIYLGDSSLNNQVMDSKLSMSETNIKDSGYKFSDMGGILIFLNEKVFYATEWDDKPIVLEEVMVALRPKPKKINELNEVINSPEAMQAAHDLDSIETDSTLEADKKLDNPEVDVQTKEVLAKAAPEVDIQTEKVVEKAVTEVEVQTEEVLEKAALEVEVQTEEVLEKVATEVNLLTEKVSEKVVPEVNLQTEQVSENAVRQDKMDEELEVDQENSIAKRIFERYPRMYPFEDNEVIACVKLEPQDIAFLPMEAWGLCNNSFLLHGYYSYRHLIFAKIKDRYGCRYILGVPGIFHNRERFMARMFGFEQFKSVRKRELKPGEFGYWYITITM